jgi:hypothetical protein
MVNIVIDKGVKVLANWSRSKVKSKEKEEEWRRLLWKERKMKKQLARKGKELLCLGVHYFLKNWENLRYNSSE